MVHRHPPIGGAGLHVKPNLTASTFARLATDRMVTRRARLMSKVALSVIVILALTRYVATGASDGVR